MKTKYFDWKNNVDESELNKIKEILNNECIAFSDSTDFYQS